MKKFLVLSLSDIVFNMGYSGRESIPVTDGTKVEWILVDIFGCK